MKSMMSRYIFVALALSVLFAGLCAAHVTTSQYLEWSGSWPFGSAVAVTVDAASEVVYLGSGGAVLVLDVSDPTDPRLLSDAIRTRGYVQELAFDASRSLLFIAADEGGLEIWDCATPSAPVQLSSIEVLYFDVETPVSAISLEGDFAYLCCDWGYVHWINVSDPVHPVDEGFTGVGGNPTSDVYAVDGWAYSAGPKVVRYYIDPTGALYSSGYHEFYAGAGTVYAEGNEVYVGYSNSLYILDANNPYLSTLSVTNTSGVRDIVVVDNLGYLVNGDGLYILDVNDPSNPQTLSFLDTEVWTYKVARASHLAYIAAGADGLRVIDVSNPAVPVEIGSFDTFSATWDAVIDGDLAYLVGEEDGLLIVDLSDPNDTFLVGSYDSPGIARDVKVRDGLAYIADWNGGFRIIDVSNPAAPVHVGALETIDAWRLDLTGNYAYVTDGIPNQPDWLHVIDISDPVNPVEVSAMVTPGTVWEVVVSGDYVFLANDTAGVRVVDVSDPTQPFFAGFYDAPDVWDLCIQGSYAYLASTDWLGGFLTLDISTPTNPILVSAYNPTGWFHPYKLTVDGDFAYVSRDEDVHLLDISDKTNPVERDVVSLPETVSSLSASGSVVYLSDISAGLKIYTNALAGDLLQVDVTSLSAATGGVAIFTLSAGVENAGRDYLLVGGLSGTDPGTLLPGGQVTIPVNRDWFTGYVLSHVNQPPFAQFLGTLSTTGIGVARLDTLGPISPSFVGETLCFAYATKNPWDFASNAVTIDILP